MRRLSWLLLGALVLLLALPAFAAQGAPAPSGERPSARTAPWPRELVELAERLPVQEGGRVKPLLTHARYLLLRLNGRQSVKTPAGEKLGPVEWLLDLFFFPEISEDYPVFLVQDEQVIEAIGLRLEGKQKRDRYSFRELRPGVGRLFELGRQYDRIEEKSRSSVQQQVFLLAVNVDEYTKVLTHFDFARARLGLGADSELRNLFGGAGEIGFSQLIDHAAGLREMQTRLAGAGNAPSGTLRAVAGLMQAADELASGTEALTLFPPEAPSEAENAWLSPAELVHQAFSGGRVAPRHVEMLAQLERAATRRDDPAAVNAALARFSSLALELAAARGEERKLDLEVSYYKAGLLGTSQALFVCAFLLAAVLWIRPRSRWLYWSTAGAVGAATLLLTVVIVMRCMIRGRPPVSTLYETLLFVTAVGSATALVAELINRQKIALSAAAVLGMIGLFVCNGYEMIDKRDTMPSLIAVLDTNFWLATHVTSITVGYSAGVLATLLADFWLLARIFGWGRAQPGFQHGLVRTVYGVLGFGLIFSTVGTILGGVWANESWGRFWGWDPKENGALLIVLSQLAILHARMAGMLREFGFCMATAFGGIVIAFSWFGVNLLGVGLHSYGFTSGINAALTAYYAAQGGLLVVAAVHWKIERSRAALPGSPGGAASPGAGGAA